MPARIASAKQARAAVALAVAGLVAVGSPGVANAYPGTGSQRDQVKSRYGCAGAIGGSAVPQKWLDPFLADNAPGGTAARPPCVSRSRDDDDDTVIAGNGGQSPGSPSGNTPSTPTSMEGPPSLPSVMPGEQGGAPTSGAAAVVGGGAPAP